MTALAFAFSCDSLPTAELVGWKGKEQLCRPFAFEAFVTLPAGEDPTPALGASATLTASFGDDPPMAWHGVVVALTLWHETASRALYGCTLVPRLALLGSFRRSFVHTEVAMGAFLQATVEAGGLTSDDFRFELAGASYPTEEFVCQYRESHLDFIHRWLEREGAYYYFEHPAASGASATAVFVHDKGQHAALPGARPIPLIQRTGGVGETMTPAFHELTWELVSTPAKVRLTEYNYARPAVEIDGEGAVSQAGHGELRTHGYRLFDDDEATRLATTLAEALTAASFVLHARGSAHFLRSGYVFDLEEAPGEGMATRWLATVVEHAGALSGATAEVRQLTGLDAGETYRVSVSAIDANVQYRQPPTTRWPRVHGSENAIVDGPASSEYAQVDDDGRYLVKLHFDASALGDGEASTFMRMMQPHGGTAEGHHFPLRKGTEVMVGFQGGDPDRPFITGAVPNARKPSVIVRENHTQHIILTGGGNYFCMDDAEGQEMVTMSSPTQLSVFELGAQRIARFFGFKGLDLGTTQCSFFAGTDANAGYRIGGGWWEDIGGEKRVHVGGDATYDYDAKLTTEIGGTLHETIDGNRVEKTTGTTVQTHQSFHLVRASSTRLDDVAGGLHEIKRHGILLDSISGDWRQTVSGAVTENYAATQMTMVVGSTEFKSTSTLEIHSGLVVMLGGAIEAKGHALAAWYVPSKMEFFHTKTALVGHKTDLTGLSIGYTADKKEVVHQAVGVGGVKVEYVGNKNELVIAKSEEKHLFETAIGAMKTKLSALIKRESAIDKKG